MANTVSQSLSSRLDCFSIPDGRDPSICLLSHVNRFSGPSASNSLVGDAGGGAGRDMDQISAMLLFMNRPSEVEAARWVREIQTNAPIVVKVHI